MPNTYIRQRNAPQRGTWTSEDLRNAINAVTAGDMGVNEAAVSFGIPKTTFKRRLATKNVEKHDRLGPDSMLGKKAEEKLSTHIKKLQKHGFAPTRTEVRIMAYDLAKRLGITNRFSEDKGKAGKCWLYSFLRRNPEIVVRKAENTSIARANGMSKDVVKKYFEQLEKVLTDNDLFDKPGNIYNTDETGLQLNTRAGEVLAQRGSKSVPSISPSEKGETISVIACCSAEGGYLPPYCIFKGKNMKAEWCDGMPPASRIRMSEKSAYVTSDIFLDWLKTHFWPRKAAGITLLILDGHTSHTTNIETLEFAEQHEIILFCLPPHCTHYLQPLDRSFFKSLKGHYYEACRRMVKSNPNRRLNRLQFGKLLGESWGNSATVNNAVSAFRATGIFPLNPDVIPDYAFLQPTELIVNAGNKSPQSGPSGINPGRGSSTGDCTGGNTRGSAGGIAGANTGGSVQTDAAEIQQSDEIETPGKALDAISPIPVITSDVKRVRSNLSGILTSSENIKKRKDMDLRKKNAKPKPKSQPKNKRCPKKARREASSSSCSDDVVLHDSSSGNERISDIENECIGCGEDYRRTSKKEDWIMCLLCSRWLHEGCTPYNNVCRMCGVTATKKKTKNM